MSLLYVPFQDYPAAQPLPTGLLLHDIRWLLLTAFSTQEPQSFYSRLESHNEDSAASSAL